MPFDYDRDGDLDLLVVVNDGVPRLYRNDLVSGQSHLTVRLFDPGRPNTEGVGAIVRVRATASGPVQRRDIHLNATYGGHRPAEAHFGFGAHTGTLFDVRITWPDGATQVLDSVAPNQRLYVVRED